MMRKIIGIDPGAKGAIAVVEIDYDENDNIVKRLIFVKDMPTMTEILSNKKKRQRVDIEALAVILKPFADADMLIIEKVSARPNQGVTSMFALGLAFGCAQGVAAGLGIPIRLTRPQEWRKAVGLYTGSSKNVSRELATSLFPEWKSTFKLVKHDGRAEAALMAISDINLL